MMALGLLMAGIVVLLAGAADLAQAASATDRCTAAKIKAHGKARDCTAKALAKAALGGPADVDRCEDKLQADLRRAKGCRFVDNADGTVTDLDTGLMWEKKVAGTGLHGGSATRTWTDALSAFVSALNGTGTAGGLGGHRDWRIPTVDELRSIFDHTVPGCLVPVSQPAPACIDPVFGPTPNDYYWSCETSSGDSTQAEVFTYSAAGSPRLPKSWAVRFRGVRTAF
jgi:hypothetical protein